MVNNNFDAILVILIILVSYFIYKMGLYARDIKKKNMRLMQLYLDSQFIGKLLVQSLKMSKSIKFCNDTINQIKSYYNLEDIIIVDSVKMLADFGHNPLRSGVMKFIKTEIEPMMRILSGHHTRQFSLKIEDRDYVLHISRLSLAENSNGVIVCVENYPSLIGKNEKLGLENSINLLKNRLFYE